MFNLRTIKYWNNSTSSYGGFTIAGIFMNLSVICWIKLIQEILEIHGIAICSSTELLGFLVLAGRREELTVALDPHGKFCGSSLQGLGATAPQYSWILAFTVVPGAHLLRIARVSCTWNNKDHRHSAELVWAFPQRWKRQRGYLFFLRHF